MARVLNNTVKMSVKSAFLATKSINQITYGYRRFS